MSCPFVGLTYVRIRQSRRRPSIIGNLCLWTGGGAQAQGERIVKLMPIVYVSDMGRALDFYSAFGLESSAKDRSPMWAELSLGNAVLALHHANPLPDGHGRVELALLSDAPLEALVTRLRALGITLEREIRGEPFGRSIQVRDPDGLLIQINEHHTT
jgi:catechol 2,3-dioxygenase-like lactoylglutathione lyase family enzyme